MQLPRATRHANYPGGKMNTIVKTQSGKVRGTTVDGVNAFKGIPYAAPPFGANRFHPPRPVQPWTGVRDALNFGPKSPQPPYPPPVKLLLPPELTTSGTDCLSLNIWAPADGPTGKTRDGMDPRRRLWVSRNGGIALV